MNTVELQKVTGFYNVFLECHYRTKRDRLDMLDLHLVINIKN